MQIKKFTFHILFFTFIALSFLFNFGHGKEIAYDFYHFFKSMASFLPAVFILIGIFEVWVKKETIEAHMGDKSGAKGFLWAILLSGTSIGGLYVAFPIAYSLQQKGARLSVIFTYIGSAAVARVPMSIYEASYVGIKFTIIRLCVSLPLVILSSMAFEKYLNNKNYKIKNIKKN